jgi:glycosyltransferase involved in cell wall biosynthesis
MDNEKEHASLVSVIIPVYNGEGYLAEAIESIRNQIYQPIEIIIVDDGSTDGSAALIKSLAPGVKYIFQTNRGTAAARNRGVNEATGDFFAFLDQDDLWHTDKLTNQMHAFGADPELDAVFGQLKQFLSPDLDNQLKQKIYCPDKVMPGYSPSALLIKRKAFFEVGYFETNWQIGEWADWYVRAVEKRIRMKTIAKLVTWRRLHQMNKGLQQRQAINEYLHILKASLDRRRAQV